MDPVYQEAVNRLQALEIEAKELREFIDLYRKTRQRLGLDGQKKAAETLPEPEVMSSNSRTFVSRASRPVGSPKPAHVSDESLEVLREHGSPMTRRELYNALVERGTRVLGTDPIKALGTILWRSRDRIIQLEGHGYWDRALPCPSVGYDPTDTPNPAA